jgi:hypothetical protein
MSAVPLRVVLICHHDAPLHYEGVARWIASWSTLAGVVVIREQASVLRRRLRREWKRVGFLRLIDVLAFRVYYRLRHATGDASWIASRLREMRNRFPDVPTSTPIIEVASPASRESQSFIEARRCHRALQAHPARARLCDPAPRDVCFSSGNLSRISKRTRMLLGAGI